MTIVFKKSSNDFSKAKLFPLPVAELSYNESNGDVIILVKNQDLQDKYGITESELFQNIEDEETYDLSIFHTFLDGEDFYEQSITASGSAFLECFNSPTYVYKVHSPPYIKYQLQTST
jgi:hypothetical protein